MPLGTHPSLTSMQVLFYLRHHTLFWGSKLLLVPQDVVLAKHGGQAVSCAGPHVWLVEQACRVLVLLLLLAQPWRRLS